MFSSASSISGPTIASTSSFHGPGQPRASNSSAPPLESLSRFTPLTVNQAYSQRGAKAPLTRGTTTPVENHLRIRIRNAGRRTAHNVSICGTLLRYSISEEPDVEFREEVLDLKLAMTEDAMALDWHQGLIAMLIFATSGEGDRI